MARVFITTAGADTSVRDELVHRARCDRFGLHGLTDDPETSDLVLFMEAGDDPFQDEVRGHPFVRRYRNKSFCVSERDYTFPFLPGVYTSVSRRWYRPSRMRSGFYLVMFQHGEIDYAPATGFEPHLFSFVGSFHTAPVRSRLGELRHPRGHIENTAPYARAFAETTQTQSRAERVEVYWDMIRDSQFVLCPRGRAPSTTRLFDVLQAGRVPVVLSDEWVPPEGPLWEQFCIRVPEADVEEVPVLLERLAPQAPTMGRAARKAWEEWFAPDVTFHRIVEWCLAIRERRTLPETVLRAQAFWQLLFQPYRYNYYRSRVAHYETLRDTKPIAGLARWLP